MPNGTCCQLLNSYAVIIPQSCERSEKSLISKSLFYSCRSDIMIAKFQRGTIILLSWQSLSLEAFSPQYLRKCRLQPVISSWPRLHLFPDDPCSDWGEAMGDNAEFIRASGMLFETLDTGGILTSEERDSIFPLMLFWSKNEGEEGAYQVEKLLKVAENEIQMRRSLPKPACKYFTLAIDAWGKSGYPEKAKTILDQMCHLSRSDLQFAPTRVTYNAMMNAYSKQGQAQEVAEILAYMENSPDLKPITNDYNVLLSSYAKLGDGRNAEEVLRRMIGLSSQNEKACDIEPDLFSYNSLLDAWSKSKEPGRGKRAEDILSTLEAKSDAGEFDWAPDARSYSAAILAIAHSGEASSLERAEKLWERAEARCVEFDAYISAALLDAFASSNTDGSAEKAEKILEKLESSGNVNEVAYNMVLKAWKVRNGESAIERAELIFQKMTEKNFADAFSFCTLIALHANKATLQSAERAEELLHSMEEAGLRPNVQTLNAVMNAWSKCGKLDRAERVLEEMEMSYYDKRSEVRIAPNVVSYTTLMNGWAKFGLEEAVEKTRKTFGRMQGMYRSGNQDARPNLVSYVTLINSITKSATPEAANMAERAIFDMYEEYKAGKVDELPNTHLVTSVIDCWQKSGANDAGERAELLLNWLLLVHEKEGAESLQPNEFTFNSVISAWARTRKFGKALRARAVLERMITLKASGVISASPNAHCYTAVINSCAYCENDSLEKRQSLQIAIETYKEMLRSLPQGPNQVTFATLITALRNTMPASEKRTAALATIFKTCAEKGQVSDLVVRRLQSTLSVDQLSEVFGKNVISPQGRIDIKQIPQEWKRNTKMANPRQSGLRTS